MKYLYSQIRPTRLATPSPHKESSPRTMTNRIAPSGTHIGLEIKISGAKMMRPIRNPVIVMPVRRRSTPPKTVRVRRPMNRVEVCAGMRWRVTVVVLGGDGG